MSHELARLVENLEELDKGEDLTIDLDETAKEVTIRLYASSESYKFTETSLQTLVEDVAGLSVDKDKAVIRTKTKTFFILNPENFKAQTTLFFPPQSFNFKFSEAITFTFLPNCLLVGIVAMRSGAYDKHVQPPDSHPSLEISYTKPADKLTAPEEEHIVDAFLYQLATSDGIILTRKPMSQHEVYDPFTDEPQEYKPTFQQVETFNEAMQLFLAASTVSEVELRYLSFYKVIEYFGPVVFKMERNEALRKKLDSPEAGNPDATFLESLHSLTLSLKDRSSDDKIPQFVIEKCVDFLDIAKLLPPSLQKPLTYSSQKTEIEAHIKNVGAIMYSTRNKVAHAKSNYSKVGNEIAGNELEALIRFTEAVAVRAIRWYNRLPQHLKNSSSRVET